MPFTQQDLPVDSHLFQLKEKTMKTVQAASAATLFAMAALLAPASLAQAPAEIAMSSADELKWADFAALPPGAKVAVIQGPPNEAKPYIVRLKFPANYKVPVHTHPGAEHLTVISGTFHLGTGDKADPKQTRALTPGSVAVIQPNIKHFAWTNSETVVQLHGIGPSAIAYPNPADDPRKN
jgi:quercetin dioxygenase-like cupin family protein